MSQEIYGSRPGSENVWRFDESDRSTKPEKLVVDTSKPFEKRYVLLTDSHYKHTPFTQQLIGPLEHGGLFKGYHVMNGSIGTNMAQLWKSEVAAMVLQPHAETPWDFCPTYGISRKLGLVFCKIDRTSNSLVPYEPRVSPVTHFRPFEVLVVHENYVEHMNYKIKKS
jgi:fructose-1,6-bisphosphatase/inositol monophosphatase family enzyme